MIIFTNHVNVRMIERKITKEMVRQVVNSPDNTFRDAKNRIIAQKEFGRKIIEVIYAFNGENEIVLTCYYL